MLERMPEHQIPSTRIIREIMKDKFSLKYKRLDKANTKYRDSAYNEKRIWVSRLIA